MPDQVTLYASRKAYDFRPEGIRLTVLSMPTVQERIRQVFAFQASALGTPQPTFGDVPATLPPGLVFNLGIYTRPSGQVVPIRLLHIEPRRIVIDIAGPSSDIDEIFTRLWESIENVVAVEGGSAIKEPYRVSNYSEVVLRLRIRATSLVPSPLLQVAQTAWRGATGADQFALVPAVTLIPQDPREDFLGVPTEPGNRVIQIAPRQGYPLEEQMYFSVAPLDSDRHLAYLSQLEDAFDKE